jgi:hypothetical protein
MSASSCSILARSVSRPITASSRTRRSDVVIIESFPLTAVIFEKPTYLQ